MRLSTTLVDLMQTSSRCQSQSLVDISQISSEILSFSFVYLRVVFVNPKWFSAVLVIVSQHSCRSANEAVGVTETSCVDCHTPLVFPSASQDWSHLSAELTLWIQVAAGRQSPQQASCFSPKTESTKTNFGTN